MKTVASEFSKFVVGLKYEDLPKDVVNDAKNCIIDQLGVELRAATLPWLIPPYRMVQKMNCSKPESTIVCHGDKVLCPYAAYVNASYGQGCELDDVVLGGGHAGAVTVPVATAVGELIGASGKDYITSVVAGYEIMPRMGDALGRAIHDRGFHIHAVTGVFSAATVAGKLLKFTEEQFVNALSIAGSHASGTMEYDQMGGEVKRVHSGIAVRGGIQSALLVQEGLTGPPTIFEGVRGVIHAFGDGDPWAITKDLGKGFRISKTLLKSYPVNGTQHGPIDLLRQLMKEGFDYRDVEEINAAVADFLVAHISGVYHPTDVIGAQMSLPYSSGLRLVKDSNDISLYINPECWKDKDVLAIADKVKVAALPEAVGDNHRAARVEIKLKGGKKLEAKLQYPKGHYMNPLTKEELQAKFRSLALTALPSDQVETLLDALDHLEDVKDVATISSLLARK